MCHMSLMQFFEVCVFQLREQHRQKTAAFTGIENVPEGFVAPQHIPGRIRQREGDLHLPEKLVLRLRIGSTEVNQPLFDGLPEHEPDDQKREKIDDRRNSDRRRDPVIDKKSGDSQAQKHRQQKQRPPEINPQRFDLFIVHINPLSPVRSDTGQKNETVKSIILNILKKNKYENHFKKRLQFRNGCAIMTIRDVMIHSLLPAT